MKDHNFSQKENILLVGVIYGRLDDKKVHEHLDELSLLTETAGGNVISRVTQKISKINPSFFIGKGKAEEIIQYAKDLKITSIIFDDELSPSHLKNYNNLSKEIKIIDRSMLILEIFKQHAQTKEAKTQVELAELQYMLPRLTRAWTHLERQMGGIGTRAGAGETQIEVDRRLVRTRISKLKTDLKKIENERELQRKRRGNFFKVTLVGYTNAGKSTLMKAMSGSNVFIQNQLFATLDTTTRLVELDNAHSIMLSDTVGFVRKLPHHLVASFKSTLKEIVDSDLILIVLDSSSKQVYDHYKTIIDVLKDLGAERHKTLVTLNKVDHENVEHQITYLKRKFPKGIFVSALNQLRINILSKEIMKLMDEIYQVVDLKFSYTDSKAIAQAQEGVDVLERNYHDDHVRLKIKGSSWRIEQIQSSINK